MQQFDFKTKNKNHPAVFSVLLKKDMPVLELRKKLAMLSQKPIERVLNLFTPAKFSIPSVTDPQVVKLLEEGTTSYQFMLLPNKTADEPKPLDIVNQMQETKWLISEANTPTSPVIDSYNWNSGAHEIFKFQQAFNYEPKLTDLGMYHAKFRVSVTRNGTIYGIVQQKGVPRPTPRQLKLGMSSYNFKLKTGYHVAVATAIVNTLTNFNRFSRCKPRVSLKEAPRL